MKGFLEKWGTKLELLNHKLHLLLTKKLFEKPNSSDGTENIWVADKNNRKQWDYDARADVRLFKNIYLMTWILTVHGGDKHFLDFKLDVFNKNMSDNQTRSHWRFVHPVQIKHFRVFLKAQYTK